jgi:hypothetical protein
METGRPASIAMEYAFQLPKLGRKISLEASKTVTVESTWLFPVTGSTKSLPTWAMLVKIPLIIQ